MSPVPQHEVDEAIEIARAKHDPEGARLARERREAPIAAAFDAARVPGDRPLTRVPVEPEWMADRPAAAPGAVKVPSGGLKTFSMAELIAMEPNPPPMLGCIPEIGLTVLAGSPKVGKTLLASQFALCVGAIGPEDARPDFLGRSVRGGPVLVIVEEGSIAGISWRLRHQAEALGVLDAALDVGHRQRIRLDDARSVKLLRAKVDQLRPTLVVVDPLNRLHGADENRPTQMTPVMDALAGIAYDYRCAVLAIHHLAKPSAERSGPIWDRFRGATSIRSGTDANLALDGNGSIVQLVGEFRDAEPIAEYLELDRESLTFRSIEGPKVPSKIDPAELLEYVRDRGQATAQQVMERFTVKSKATALAALDGHPDLDSFEGPRRMRVYTPRTVQ